MELGWLQKVRDAHVMIRHGRIGAHVDPTQKRLCLRAGVSQQNSDTTVTINAGFPSLAMPSAGALHNLNSSMLWPTATYLFR
ncbi:hypothetical protein [Rhodoferax aquaticus]|uniref:Uncharacterized protein n=1 Tax=Rhodoferax aquaticus TaxID=2527691 RepID=A0A515ESY5_9BURK|nr:hypothetical protein [Rhodoferax aquaticus]QDL55780.1 hypothetical protein EXZ61_17255 [Rhodoferax aquaticus]